MTFSNQFESEQFDEMFHYDGKLGAVCCDDSTEFRVWAPTAEKVVLRLFEDGTDSKEFTTEPMSKGEKGVWSLVYPIDLRGVYYDYEITACGETRRTADPYAYACGVNGKRSLVIDLRSTDPVGWSKDKALAKQNEDIIYEIHVKDFSYDPASGVPKEKQGKYAALCESGTTLNNDRIHPTCLDYLKRLGVTHIQLMPSFDYGSVDELGSNDQFNWGYDPTNYNIPEGSYSLDPTKGELRISEMKKAIMTLHQNGFRVIMDVVYNHTYKLDSYLWRTVPGYYYRSDDSGRPSNGSGCGNDLASERSMCARYIRESVLYWAEEYHIDGFRFDLMALLDVPLMNDIQASLDSIYGEGEKLVFGEPWSADVTSARPGTMLADKSHMKDLNGRIGAFCDATRDCVKGSVLYSESKGFINGGTMNALEVKNCLCGWSTDNDRFSVKSPYQTITYISSHDDWTLWDKIVCSTKSEKCFERKDPDVLRANKLAAAIYFCCQGHLFLLSGEEFGRSKHGIMNTYSSSPEINCLDWKRAWEFEDLVDYYRGLIELRKLLPGICDKTENAADNILSVKDAAYNCVTALVCNEGHGDSCSCKKPIKYTCEGSGAVRTELSNESCVDNKAENSKRYEWKELFMIFSSNDKKIEAKLPSGSWQCLVDGNSSFCWKERSEYSGRITVDAMTALIFGKLG